jgi:hypothetical protein
MAKVSFGPLDAHQREAAAKVKVNASISHRRLRVKIHHGDT